MTHTRFPTEKAHGNQVAQVCHALALLGHEVTLLAPTVRNSIQSSAHEYYGLPESFTLVHPGSFDALSSPWVPGRLSFAVSMWSYRRAVHAYLASHPSDLLYVRSPALLKPLLETQLPVYFELHTLPRFSRAQFVRDCNRCFKIICMTSPMRDALLSWGVDPVRTVVEGDAADLGRFANAPPVEASKTNWHLPTDRPVIGYIGTLVTQQTIEKGVGECVRSLSRLKKDGVSVLGWIVGGPQEWCDTYKAEALSLGLDDSDIRFQGPVPARQVASAINACDVCVYPAPASTHPYFIRDTSPLKLFEYLAAGKPIACAELPPLRDVVDERSVRFCPPGDPDALAIAIRWILEHPEEAQAMVAVGKDVAAHHSWEQRMERIVGRA